MIDLIDREAILKDIEKIRQNVQMMDDTHRASITMNGVWMCEKAVRNQPSAEPLTEEDYAELRDRFGEYVEFVVRDMITGKGERWIKVKDGDV